MFTINTSIIHDSQSSQRSLLPLSPFPDQINQKHLSQLLPPSHRNPLPNHIHQPINKCHPIPSMQTNPHPLHTPRHRGWHNRTNQKPTLLTPTTQLSRLGTPDREKRGGGTGFWDEECVFKEALATFRLRIQTRGNVFESKIAHGRMHHQASACNLRLLKQSLNKDYTKNGALSTSHNL